MVVSFYFDDVTARALTVNTYEHAACLWDTRVHKNPQPLVAGRSLTAMYTAIAARLPRGTTISQSCKYRSAGCCTASEVLNRN